MLQLSTWRSGMRVGATHCACIAVANANAPIGQHISINNRTNQALYAPERSRLQSGQLRQKGMCSCTERLLTDGKPIPGTDRLLQQCAV